MANIELRNSNIDMIIAPFPGTSAILSVSTDWVPLDRNDVRDQNASLQDIIEAGHPLAAAASRIQNTATTFLENQFGARGESLVSSPVSSFTISWSFEHPADFATTGVELKAVGIWKPVEYPEARPQVESINQSIGSGHALIVDFQAISDYVLTMAQAAKPEHTITEPV